jgi:hypothetical protein
MTIALALLGGIGILIVALFFRRLRSIDLCLRDVRKELDDLHVLKSRLFLKELKAHGRGEAVVDISPGGQKHALSPHVEPFEQDKAPAGPDVIAPRAAEAHVVAFQGRKPLPR